MHHHDIYMHCIAATQTLKTCEKHFCHEYFPEGKRVRSANTACTRESKFDHPVDHAPSTPKIAHKVGHLVVDVLEPLFYTMLDMAGGNVSSWDTNVILGELSSPLCVLALLLADSGACLSVSCNIAAMLGYGSHLFAHHVRYTAIRTVQYIDKPEYRGP